MPTLGAALIYTTAVTLPRILKGRVHVDNHILWHTRAFAGCKDHVVTAVIDLCYAAALQKQAVGLRTS